MAEFSEVLGTICAPRGFRAAGVAAGIKPSGNRDVTLIASDFPATAAAVFTTNRVCAAPVHVSRQHVANGRARAIIVNAGNANACTGEQGMKDALRMAALTAEGLGIAAEEVLVASTGVIGRMLPMERVEAGIAAAVEALSPDGGENASLAIMTTDLRPKRIALEVRVGERSFRIGGICKGSGMIHPNMATLLAFVTTDADVPASLLQETLRTVADATFNCVTVDGDTSTNDTLVVLANGASGVSVQAGTEEYAAFQEGLRRVCTHLSKELARDGEGATKLVEVCVTGAATVEAARKVGKTVANSPLVKTALFGNDPNWGRILCAVGYSGIEIAPERVSLKLCGYDLVRGGEPVPFQEAEVSAAMKTPEVLIEVDLGQGDASGSVWTCDFSYDYVRINAEYTT